MEPAGILIGWVKAGRVPNVLGVVVVKSCTAGIGRKVHRGKITNDQIIILL